MGESEGVLSMIRKGQSTDTEIIVRMIAAIVNKNAAGI